MFIQKYAVLRLLQKFLKISGFLFKTIIDNFIDNINNARVLFEDNLRQLDVVQTNEHSEMRQIVRAIRRDKNYCQIMDIFGADATLCLGIAR